MTELQMCTTGITLPERVEVQITYTGPSNEVTFNMLLLQHLFSQIRTVLLNPGIQKPCFRMPCATVRQFMVALMAKEADTSVQQCLHKLSLLPLLLEVSK